VGLYIRPTLFYILYLNKLKIKNMKKGKWIEKTLEDGIEVLISFEKFNEEELGLDYGTLDEVMEVKEVDGIKLYFVYL
jgi:hypothetical protein